MHALNAWNDLQREFMAIAERRGCSITIEETSRVEHAQFDLQLVQRVSDTAHELAYSTHSMVSGAGHDASYINQIASTAMIFVPSINGRSHVEVENTHWTDCEAGANVLLHCILKSANETKIT
jgi:N-carbamoyl-L-amino-acid hydrolase